jgi:hypothetical protein
VTVIEKRLLYLHFLTCGYSRVKRKEKDASKRELSGELLRKLENVIFWFLMAKSKLKERFPLYNDLWAYKIQDGGQFPMVKC